jgi:hypothetical protein
MANKFLYILTSLILLGFSVQSQELNCNVIVNADRVETTDRRIFQDMQTAFSQFLNNRRWTDDNYDVAERINCNLVITIEEMPIVGTFKATVQIQSSRPVYGTSYESLMLNFADRDWHFEYVESQPLDFNENSFSSNIASMLAYYAYIILGIDYDSFETLGGTSFFERANNQVILAQESNMPGWKQFDSQRNRYWLAENFLSPIFTPVRESIYLYHIQGLDLFLENPDASRSTILEVLKKLQVANRSRPNSIFTIAFLDAKSNELINIFSEGDMNIRRQAYEILRTLDPTLTSKLGEIINN